MRQSNERVRLLELIYEAALEPGLWPQVVNCLADVTGATVGQLGSHDSRTLEFTDIAPRVSPEAARSYADYWVYHNPLIEPTLRLPIGSVVSFETVMPRSELARTAIYNEFFAPNELVETLGTPLLADGSFSAMVALYRAGRKGPFDREQADTLRWVTPHLQRALQMNVRLAKAEMVRTASVDLLDRLGHAAVLVDRGCRVLFSNRAAEEILADPVGISRDAEGILQASRRADSAALHKVVAGAAARIRDGDEPAGGSVHVSRGPGRAALNVLAIPMRAETEWLAPRPAATLFVTDTERTRSAKEQDLRQDFGLTRMEAVLAVQMLRGDGLKAAAQRLGIAPTTARTHLTAVFGKTGTRRQAELVRVLMGKGAG